MIDISIEIAGVRFDNPLFAASGSATNCGEKIRRIAFEGKPGGIVTKSVSVDVGQKWGRGSKQPTPLCWPWLQDRKFPGMVVVCAKGEILTCDDWFEREMPVAVEGGVPIIASVSGAPSMVEWIYLAENFQRSGAVMIELNYQDAYGRDLSWYHGFYYRDPSPNWPLKNGEKILPFVWYPFESENLMEALDDARPVQVRSLRIYSSGWNYRAMVSEVGLIAE